jgi:hypothetical protein
MRGDIAIVRQHIEKIDGVTRTWFEWTVDPTPCSCRAADASPSFLRGPCYIPHVASAASAAAGSAFIRYTVGRFTPVALAT